MPFWIPFIITTAASTSVPFGLNFFNNRKLNNQQKEQTSNTANDIEDKLKRIQTAYFQKVDRTTLDKQTALNYMEGLMQELQNTCNRIGGNAGSNCIKDRIRGGKFDWYASYFDPIILDNPPEPTMSQALENTLPGLTTTFEPILLGLIAIGAVYAITTSKD